MEWKAEAITVFGLLNTSAVAQDSKMFGPHSLDITRTARV